MADSGRASAKPRAPPPKTKVVRSHKITEPSPLPPPPPPDKHGKHDKHSKHGKAASDDESDGSADPAPLPRSHTPGHLASRSNDDRRRKPSDNDIRQRARATSYANPPRPSTAGGHSSSQNHKHPPPPLPPPLTTASNPNGGQGSPRPAQEDADDNRKRPIAMRSTSAIVSRPSAASAASSTSSIPLPSQTPGSAVQPAPAPTSNSTAEPPTKPRQQRTSIRPSRKHVAFPPLQQPNEAPDVPPAPASGMYWSKAPTSGAPHTSLRAHTTCLIGSNVYIFGGCDSRTCFNDMYVLDADSFYWSKPYMVGDIPMPLRAMTCTPVGKKLVVFGGGDGPAYYNDVYVLDTTNFRWTKPQILGDRLPSKRRAHTACFYKNGIYVFGGGDGVRALNDIWRLDVSDMTKMSWRLISSPDRAAPGVKDYRPKARGYHTANMVGSKLIIFGGSDGGECFDDVWIYDVESHYWKSVAVPLAYRRLSHTATIVGSYLFVIGGHDGNEYSNDVLLLNLVTLMWDKRKVYGLPPSGRGYHGTVLYDSRLIVIGGFDGAEVFGDVMILELAVHAYYSQISHFTIDV
ncbi:hypothetical protein S40288_02805 [Stachybotrys chartarum IBT 40288]|nr:hypothetical protein S40288_02805 [Stachybotrys chartarum IBT 40288]